MEKHPTWTDQLGDNLKTEENYAIFDQYEKLSDFSTAFLESNGSLTKLKEDISGYEGKITAFDDQLKTMVKKPTETSTPEEVRAYYGVPENVDGYGIDDLAKDDSGKALLENFRTANLSPSQAKLMVENLARYSESETSRTAETKKAAVAKYKTDLGAKADLVFKNAEDAINKFYGKDILESMKAEIMSNPSLIDTHSKIGHILKESPGLFLGEQNEGGSGNIYESMAGLD